MALYIEIIEGFGVGERYKLREGLRLGRTVGEILIRDPKVSSSHAQIESDSGGQLWLVDRESSNGIRLKGERVLRVALLPGVLFQVGKTHVQVIEVAQAEVQEESTPGDWRTQLMHLIPKLPGKNRVVNTVFPLSPAIELTVLSGPQCESVYTLGYGPRKFGSDSLDFELVDDYAPSTAFEIVQGTSGPELNTKYPQIVNVNGESAETVTLKAGDIISLGKTTIRVEFMS